MPVLTEGRQANEHSVLSLLLFNCSTDMATESWHSCVQLETVQLRSPYFHFAYGFLQRSVACFNPYGILLPSSFEFKTESQNTTEVLHLELVILQTLCESKQNRSDFTCFLCLEFQPGSVSHKETFSGHLRKIRLFDNPCFRIMLLSCLAS